MKARSIVVLAAALGLTAPALADAPSVIPVQGYLAGADGSVVNDVFAVTFTLYSDAAGTSSLWSEEAPVNFVDGYFTAYLGSTTSLDLTTFRDNSGVYLGVKVGDDEEMTPFEVGTAPFAGFAQYAGFAADITDAAKVQIVGDVAVQLDNDGKVHDKYTDAEAIAAVTDALANDATQLEAALGTTDNSNTLNHARYTDAEAVAALASHTSDPAAHHTRFTDAEARAAVTASALTGGLEVDDIAATGGIENLTTWGLNARSQGLMVMPEGNVYEDGAGNLTLTARVIVMNPMSGTWIRAEAGTYALPSWGYLYIDLPPTGRRGTNQVPQVGTWSDTDRPFDGKDRFILAQRRGTGEIYLNFATPAHVYYPESDLTTIIRELPDERNNSAENTNATTWWTIPGRTLNFTKRFKDSHLKITYQDTLGALANDYAACEWRILLDGNQIAFFSDADLTNDQSTRNWRMSNATHTAWARGITPGAHTITIQNRADRGLNSDSTWNTVGTGTQECLMGWNTVENFLSVQEIP